LHKSQGYGRESWMTLGGICLSFQFLLEDWRKSRSQTSIIKCKPRAYFARASGGNAGLISIERTSDIEVDTYL
jgi:hypothetical protein